MERSGILCLYLEEGLACQGQAVRKFLREEHPLSRTARGGQIQADKLEHLFDFFRFRGYLRLRLICLFWHRLWRFPGRRPGFLRSDAGSSYRPCRTRFCDRGCRGWRRCSQGLGKNRAGGLGRFAFFCCLTPLPCRISLPTRFRPLKRRRLHGRLDRLRHRGHDIVTIKRSSGLKTRLRHVGESAALWRFGLSDSLAHTVFLVSCSEAAATCSCEAPSGI